MYCINCGKQIEDDSKFCAFCNKKNSGLYEVSSDDSMKYDISNIYAAHEIVNEKVEEIIEVKGKEKTEEKSEGKTVKVPEGADVTLKELKGKDVLGFFSFVMRFVYTLIDLAIGLAVGISFYRVYFHVYINKFWFSIIVIIAALGYLCIKVVKTLSLKRIWSVLFKKEKFVIAIDENRANKRCLYTHIFKMMIGCIMIPLTIIFSNKLYRLNAVSFTRDTVFEGYGMSVGQMLELNMENVKWSSEKRYDDCYYVYATGDYEDYKNVRICFEFEVPDYNEYNVRYVSMKIGKKRVDDLTEACLFDAIFSDDLLDKLIPGRK